MPRLSELFQFKALAESPTEVSLVCYSVPYQRVACFDNARELFADLLGYKDKIAYKPEVFEISIGTSGSVKKRKLSKKKLKELIEITGMGIYEERLKEMLL